MKILAVLLITTVAVSAQPQVPRKMEFAGMTLTIHDDARRELQDDVDALTKSPTYFNQKADKARAYFPIIEEVLYEERVPDDFKYLVLQESALIPDAVSVSNAVGFWQFKDYTAIEMGLRLDKQVDERMNVVASTHAAAQYLKKNNFYFNNWLYALQAYQMGAGGVMRSVKDTQGGTKQMDITSDTYWYVKRFLAHKIAFEDAVEEPGSFKLLSYTTKSKRSFSEVAEELEINEDELRAYNKWVKGNTLEANANCPLLIPVNTGGRTLPAMTKAVARMEVAGTPATEVTANAGFINRIVLMNDIPAVKARPGETATSLAKEADIRLSFFLRCNDIAINDKLGAGEYYYLDHKSNRGDVPNHLVSSGETLWGISQKYGVKLNHLMRYNDMTESSRLTPGKFVWLQNPSGNDLESADVDELDVVAVDSEDNFNWGVNPEPQASLVVQVDPASVTPRGSNAQQTIESIDSAQEDASSPDVLMPGDSSRTVFHKVLPSDTLYGVARQYGVTVQQLMDWNDKKDFNLTIGESLRIELK